MIVLSLMVLLILKNQKQTLILLLLIKLQNSYRPQLVLKGNYFGVKFWTSDNISKTKSNDYIKPQIKTSMSINLISALSENDISLQKVGQEGHRTNLYIRQNKYNTNQLVSVMKK